MTCFFSGKEIPPDRLFALYYPPAMAHYNWDKSVYATARAGEALKQIVDQLQSFHWRYVVGRKVFVGAIAGLLGLLLLVAWLYTLAAGWDEAGVVRKYVQPAAALVLLWLARFRIRAFLRRLRNWKSKGESTVLEELKAIEAEIAKMPEDPTAEQAAVVVRRLCPDVISEIAFDGTYFRAFTYMDFVMYPKLKNPKTREELPTQQSLNRDAYRVGDVIYDGWRVFHKDQRELADPRFAGSGGRRGVI